jgi:hypothetical protein
MGNNKSFYFGAYLEIVAHPQDEQVQISECDNGHASSFGAFCPQCGKPVRKSVKVVSRYPCSIEEIIGDEWTDVMCDITPPGMGDGVIMVTPNDLSAKGHSWMYLSCQWRGDNPKTKPFPTAVEIDAMKAALTKGAQDIIGLLQASPLVVSVDVRAGYVLYQEY